MNVVQLSFFAGTEGQTPADLLESRPSLGLVSRALAREGAQVTVVQVAGQEARFEQDGVHYDFRTIPSMLPGLRPRGTRWLRGFGEVCSAVGRANPDLIHVHGLIAPIQVRLLAYKLPGVPVVVQDHASHPKRGFRRWIDQWGFSKVSAVAFTSVEQAEPFVAMGIVRGTARVFEVVEASSTFTPGSQKAARDLCGLYGDPGLLWVGRLNENKDPMTVLEAVDTALHSLPELQLWCLYSDAQLLPVIRKRVERSKRLKRHVHLVGEVPHPEVESFCRAADLFTVASRSEGSGFALIEAIACGTTPLVTRIPSFRKITAGGHVGALFAPGDSQDLAAQIVRFSREAGSPGRTEVRRHFDRSLSWEAIGRRWIEVYGSLVQPS